MYVQSVDILAIDNSLECQALRANLEWWGIQVHMYWIGKASDLIAWNRQSNSPHIFLGCHGSEEGILLPELSEELAAQEPFATYLDAESIVQHFQFRSNTLLSNGCITGSRALAKAFLQSGTKHYLAPKEYIEGNASLLFSTCFYYFLFCKNVPVELAFEKASSIDEHTESFKLFTH